MSDVSHLPQPGVVLDLDAEERNPEDVRPPFTVKVSDRTITFIDPNDIDWRDLAAIQQPADLIHVSLERDDRNFLQDLTLPTWKFNRLIESYYTHYDLEAKIEAARRREQFGRL